MGSARFCGPLRSEHGLVRPLITTTRKSFGPYGLWRKVDDNHLTDRAALGECGSSPFKSRLRQRVRPPRRNGGLEQSRVSGGEELKNLYHASVHLTTNRRRLDSITLRGVSAAVIPS